MSTGERKNQILGRSFLLVLLILLIGAFIYTVKMFVLPVLLAAIFSALFYPLFRWLNKLFRGRKTLSSVITCLLLLLLLLVPVYMIANMVALEAIDLYQSSETKVKEIIAQGEDGLLGKVKNLIPERMLEKADINWQESLANIAKTIGTVLADVINKTSKSTFQLVMNLFIVLFTMFYFFQDGAGVVERIKYLSPLDDKHEDRLIARFLSVSRATIRGSLFLGLIQGILGGITLWIFGVKSVVLWTVVMVILSVIPMVGGWLVMYPVAIVKLLVGDFWQAGAIFLITILIIGNVDNLLRPRLVGKDAKMHDLMIFFSTIGGIAAFGVMGFVIGPVIAALMLTILDIYSTEFKDQLDYASNVSLPENTETSEDKKE